MNSPLVSICCITYNHERYIKDALEGFVKQKTDFPFEIIISDDCSTDKTHDIILDYKKKHPNLFRDVSPEANLGVIENWKHVHQEAKGELIAFCEGDDYWTDQYKLQKQATFMLSHSGCGLSITDFQYQNDNDYNNLSEAAFSTLNTFQPKSFIEHLKNAGYIGPMTWMYRRRVFMQNIQDYNNIKDGTLALALDLFGSSEVAYLPDVTAVYRTHSSSAANPNSALKRLEYIKGVYNIQIMYAKKYKCNQETIDNIQMQNYFTSMLLAIECSDQAFIEEAKQFCFNKGLNIKWFIAACKEYVNYKKQYEHIQSSNAYQLGRAILQPFKWFKRI